MTSREQAPAVVEPQDTSAIADSDALDRPVRQPPGAAAVKINVEGAFIVDDETGGRNGVASDHESVHREKDIRLPHHTAVVSHVAVDVSPQQSPKHPHLC